MKHITKGLILYFVCCMLIGAYMMIIHWLGIALWPEQARGSLIRSSSGEIRGSFLLGQTFTHPKYFKGRPKEVIDNQCNLQFYLAPYKDAIEARLAEDHGATKYAELIVPSASGLDPYISLRAALSQVPHVAKYRGVSEAELERVVLMHALKARWPFFDMDIVNVVRLNSSLP